MSKPYIRNQKGFIEGQGKWGICEQDKEDFDQEKIIQEWLKREGRTEQLEYKHISSKGTPRNTLDTRSIRLDQKVSDGESSRTYADIIAGSDGRNLECGLDCDTSDPGPETAADRLEIEFNLFFDAIRASERTKTWAKKLIKLAPNLRNFRSLMSEDEQYETFLINLE